MIRLTVNIYEEDVILVNGQLLVITVKMEMQNSNWDLARTNVSLPEAVRTYVLHIQTMALIPLMLYTLCNTVYA